MESTVFGLEGKNVVLMETVTDLRMTSDEAPLRRGGGMQYALQALPRRRLLLPVLALGVLLLLTGCADHTYKAHIRRGHEYTEAANFPAAEREFREAVRLNHDGVWAHYGLANALWFQEKLEEANAEMREAIRVKPDWADAHHGLGVVLRDQGKTGEAIAEFREAIRLKPDLAEAHNNLGVMLGKKGETEEKIKEYREAIRIRPDFTSALENLAKTLDERGERKEARGYWVRALKEEKDSVWVEKIKARLAEPD